MTFTDFINENWALILISIAMVLLMRINVFMNPVMKREMYMMVALMTLLGVVTYIETCLGNMSTYSPWRAFLSMIKYSIPTVLIAETIFIVYSNNNKHISKVLFVPAILNCLLSILSLKTGIIFSFNKDTNSFVRGKLGMVPFCVCGFYLILFTVFFLLNDVKQRRDERYVVYFMVVSAGLITVLPLILAYDFNEVWFSVTAAVDLFVYYVFIMQQMTQRDALTGLLNRQSYYFELENNKNDINAVIAADMNGLKELNDHQGHVAGDKALKTIGECFLRNTDSDITPYRVGGDEFLFLGMNQKEEKLAELIENMKKELEKEGYFCSFGFSIKEGNKSVDDMIHEADQRMYAEKDEYYRLKGGR